MFIPPEEDKFFVEQTKQYDDVVCWTDAAWLVQYIQVLRRLC